MENKPPHKALTPPTPNPPPIPNNKLSRTQGYICTCLKSSNRTVFIPSVNEGILVCDPAVFCPEPSGRALADGGGVENCVYVFCGGVEDCEEGFWEEGGSEAIVRFGWL